MVKTSLFTVLAGLCVLMSGCSDDAPPPPASGRVRPSEPLQPPANPSAAAGALFRLPTPDGQAVTVQAPAALFFYTSWCGYCKQVMPEVNRLAGRARQRGWQVYGIQVGEDPAKAHGFIQQYGPNFPVLLDSGNAVARQYGIRGYPTFIVIDANGSIIYNGHEPPRSF
ncbi:MAG: TlpA family protein disulfide reductase [Planctomycetes bacterium]|nr:TlpA family protein disulfide reductase [Planctomycetota bacterium]